MIFYTTYITQGGDRYGSDYCRKKGYSVQFVDLRWGISAEAASNQKTMPICLGEVDRCNRLSPRPNFIAMIGNRYGWVPLPYAIKETEFKIIDAAVCKHDKYILNRKYFERYISRCCFKKHYSRQCS